MNLHAGVLAVLVLSSLPAGPAIASGEIGEERVPVSENFYEEWSGQVETCPFNGSEQLHSLAVPVSLRGCRTGGMGTNVCQVRCNRMFGFYYSDCSVECIDGYYACCNCDDGAICRCYMDHEEMWPVMPKVQIDVGKPGGYPCEPWGRSLY